MTFSDAEEDHPTNTQTSQSTPRRVESSDSTRQDSVTSQSRTESGLSSASAASSTEPMVSLPSTQTNTTTTSRPSAASRYSRISSQVAAAVSPAAAEAVTASNSANRLVATTQLVDSEKLVEKLKQIHGYINQTSSAMEVLEKEGDMTKINQYNTLVKIMRDLKNSEANLEDCIKKQNEAKMVSTANDASDISSNSSQPIDPPKTRNPLSMHERLTRSQEESELITAKMRETIEKREELMSRYKATRERLVNLKKQRRDLLQDERRIIHDQGTSETPYENPIPGAENWPLEQLDKAIEDFRGLYDKVDQLQTAYTLKVEAQDPSHPDEKAETATKLEQLKTKRMQLIDAITQLKCLQRAKRAEQGLPELDDDNFPYSNTASNGASGGKEETNKTESTNVKESTPKPQINGVHDSESSGEEDDEELPVRHAGTYKNPELAAQHAQLDSLKGQLENMKKLLAVAKAERIKEEKKMLERKAEVERRMAAEGNPVNTDEGATAPEEIIAGVGGSTLRVTHEELKDPVIMSKYKQLAEAKKRLGKMEEVMMMIAAAQERGQPINEALPPEYLAILEDAKNEVGESERTESPEKNLASATRSSTPRQSVPREPVVPQRQNRLAQSKMNASAFSENTSYGEDMMSGDPAHDLSELSAMERSLSKRTSRIPPVNDGSRLGYEKGAIKKDIKATRKEDPRLAEAQALKEELRLKKNLLEALMQGMGKPSSLNVENISDNLSDNVSESSAKLETSTASWGLMHSFEEHNNKSSDEDVNQESDIPQSQGRANYRYAQASASRESLLSKSRNRQEKEFSLPNDRPSTMAVNNLSTSASRSVKPKQNKFRGSSVPNTSWERVSHNPRERNYKSPQHNNQNTNKTLNAVMQQLNQVQEAIGKLHETVGHEQMGIQSMNLQQNPSMVPNFMPPMPSQTPVPQSNYPNMGYHNMMGFNPFYNTSVNQGMNAVPSQDPNFSSTNNSGAMLMGLRQCFSQLYLHSLEIQALSKHVQLIDQRDNSNQSNDRTRTRRTASYRNSQRNREHFSEEDEEEEERYNPNLLNENQTNRTTRSVRAKQSTHVPPSGTNPNTTGFINPGTIPTDNPLAMGVVNPLYSHLPEMNNPGSAAQLPNLSRQELRTDNEAFNLIPENYGRNDQEVKLLLHQYPVEEEDYLDSRYRLREGSVQIPWDFNNSISHSSDVLNNQVPPGTRANNYWDNFRSYSRQNLLSTSTKSNTSENIPSSVAPIRSLQTTETISQRHSQGNIRRRMGNQQFIRNNHYEHNNHGSQRGAVGGARAKVAQTPLVYPNTRGDYCMRNPVSSAHSRNHIQNKDKSTNQLYQEHHSQVRRHISQEHRNERLFRSPILNHEDNPIQQQNVQSQGDTQDQQELLQEIENVMKRHTNHPQFLVNLFRHASSITQRSDQQVAVDLLRELSNHRDSNNLQIRIYDNNSLKEDNSNENLSIPLQLREDEASTMFRPIQRPEANSLAHVYEEYNGASNSESSDSGQQSSNEDKEPQATGHADKNFTMPEETYMLGHYLQTLNKLQPTDSPNTSHLLTPSTLVANKHQASPLLCQRQSWRDVIPQQAGQGPESPMAVHPPLILPFEFGAESLLPLHENNLTTQAEGATSKCDKRTSNEDENIHDNHLTVDERWMIKKSEVISTMANIIREYINQIDRSQYTHSTLIADIMYQVFFYFIKEVNSLTNQPNVFEEFMEKGVHDALEENLPKENVDWHQIISRQFELAEQACQDYKSKISSKGEIKGPAAAQQSQQQILSNAPPNYPHFMEGTESTQMVKMDLFPPDKYGLVDQGLSDILPPSLPVHDLAEADQSHDLSDLQEWEDPSVEGLADVGASHLEIIPPSNQEHALDEVPIKLENLQEGAMALSPRNLKPLKKKSDPKSSVGMNGNLPCNGIHLPNGQDDSVESEASMSRQLESNPNSTCQQNGIEPTEAING